MTTDGGPSIRLVMAADDAFAMPMAVTLYSVVSHLPSPSTVEIMAFDAGMSGRGKEKIREVVTANGPTVHLTWIEPKVTRFERMASETAPRFSEAIYYRLLIPEVLPSSCRRVLYLDSDLIAEQSIAPLWQKPFDSNAACAVPERIVSCPDFGVAEWERLGLDANAPYFNSGLMLINLDAWRALDVSERACEYMLDSTNDFHLKSDQEALNAILAGHWGALDPRWNVVHLLYDSEERASMEEMLNTDLSSVPQDPYVIHFTGSEKPWMHSCPHPDRARFYHYLRRSGWYSLPEYVQWRVPRFLQRLKEVSRPLRHRVGLSTN